VDHAEPALHKAALAQEEMRSPLVEISAALHLQLARYQHANALMQQV
jgi:hypothetical protein